MDAMIFDTVIEDDSIRIPGKFKHKKVKVIIIDAEENGSYRKPVTRQINFKLDEQMDDIIPFADIENTQAFSKKLRDNHWE